MGISNTWIASQATPSTAQNFHIELSSLIMNAQSFMRILFVAWVRQPDFFAYPSRIQLRRFKRSDGKLPVKTAIASAHEWDLRAPAIPQQREAKYVNVAPNKITPSKNGKGSAEGGKLSFFLWQGPGGVISQIFLQRGRRELTGVKEVWHSHSQSPNSTVFNSPD